MRSKAGHERRAALHARMELLNRLLKRETPPRSPIFPVAVSGNSRVLEWSAHLRASGYRIPAIRYPTVPRGGERLRLSVTARHTGDQIHAVHSLLEHLLRQDGA
jgi:7-keto-8-aminopelargonate synthetase-like enzyme